MPATTAQVFGPVTVDPGFTTTGEKTLLTMSTTMPAGGRNVIIVSFVKNPSINTGAQGTYRIYKGGTLLYESKIANEMFNGGDTSMKPVLLVAVDTVPSGNDSYSFRINISAAGGWNASVHVQGIVIKTDDASWAYNTTAVSIAAGATATVTSMTTAFPAGSKVALVAVAYGSWAGPGYRFIGAGNIRLKAGPAVVASNQFNVGSYMNTQPIWVSLTYLHTQSSGSQTYSVEVANGSTSPFTFFAEIVAFTVLDGAFLDTASVALSSGVRVTVGNLVTSLSGDVAVIGLAAAENTAVIGVTAFNATDVVLQLNDSDSGQVGNLMAWVLDQTAHSGRSGVLPLFRRDTGVSNPSYQIKMTARASGINGEAKILAFALVNLVTVTDSGTGTEVVSVSVIAADSATGFDVVDMMKEIPDAGTGVEVALLNVPVDDAGAGSDVIGLNAYGFADDTGTGADSVLLSVVSDDSGLGSEVVGVSSTVPVDDAGTGYDFITGGFFFLFDDAGTGLEVIDITGSVNISDAGSAVEAVDTVTTVSLDDSGVGADTIVTEAHQFVSDSGAGVDEVIPAKEMSDFGTAIELVDMVKEAPDAGSAAELVDMAKETSDLGTGFDAIGTAKEALDAGAGVDEILPSKGVIDAGTAVELVDTAKEAFDSGAGLETINSPVFWQLSDFGAGVELPIIVVPQFDASAGVEFVGMTKEVLDTAMAIELVNMGIESIDAGVAVESVSATKESSDSGVGFEAVNITKAVLDIGAGVDVVNMSREVFDAGAGVDAVLFVSREVRDTGMAVELPIATTSIPVLDFGTGFDAVGIVATVSALDTGAGTEEVFRALSIFGDVTVDEMEVIGGHSIPYTDLIRDGLPVQVQRNAVTDFVYIDGYQVGDVLVEWEDRVADVYRGRRILTVMGLVRVVD
jgi:hypothetical protein